MSDAPQPTASPALDAAVEASALADAGIGGDGDPYDRHVVASIVSAFLLHMPDMMRPVSMDVHHWRTLCRRWATEVEDAAREQR